MARIVRHDAKAPKAIKVRDLSGIEDVNDIEKIKNYEIHVCMCGLSKNKAFCDGSHKKTSDEKDHELYHYDRTGKRNNIENEY